MIKIEESNRTIDEKYRATKLWNDLIRTFRSQLPTKCHRKNLKYYENTFTGSEAIDWLHGYLCAKSELPGKVTRSQTLILLKKFYQHGLFSESVVKNDKYLSEEVVKDDGTLFKFNPMSPTKLARTPLALKSSKNNSREKFADENNSAVKSLSYRKLTENETETTNFGQNIVDVKENLTSTKDFLIPKEPISNLCLYTRRLNSDEIENLWKSTAIARLQQILRWDSLNNVVESSNINAKFIYHNAHHFTPRGVTKVLSKQHDLPHWVLQAMKCLANWPWHNGTLNWSAYANFEHDVLTMIIDFFNNYGYPLIPDDVRELFINVLNRVEFLDVQEWDNNCYPTDNVDHSDDVENVETEGEEKIETEFGISKECSPISRLKSGRKNALSRSFSDRFGSFKVSENPRSRVSYAYGKNYSRGKSLEEVLHSFPGLIKSPRLLRSLKNTPMLNRNGAVLGKTEFFATLSSLQQDKPTASTSEPKWSQSQSRFSLASMTAHDISFDSGTSVVASSLSFFTQNGRKLACESLQLCLLFLPPKNRRWLQLLLRMMNKISINHCLRLDKFNALPNRSLVIEAFAECLLVRGQTYSRKQLVRLLTFLLDAQAELFEPPKCLEDLVKVRVENAEKEKISFTAGSTESVTFCEQISPLFYERQTLNASRQALLDLLDSMINDTKMATIEKKKRLKKFEKAYPDLFLQRFPTKSSFKAMFPNENRSKIVDGFAKLKSFRI